MSENIELKMEEKEEEETKEQIHRGQSQNDQTPKSCSNDTQIRSIGEVKAYLEHFIPPLSLTDSISIFCIKPISVLFNVFFIIYNLISVQTETFSISSYQQHRLWVIANIIGWIEITGLVCLLLSSIFAYFKQYKATFIHCIDRCGSWSSFQLFYIFRPVALLDYYQIMFSHHPLRLRETENSKKQKWRNIEDKLIYQIDHPIIFQNNELKNILNEFKDNLPSWDCLSCQNSNNCFTKKCEKCDVEKNVSQNMKDSEIMRRMTFIFIVLLSIILLFAGLLSFVLKLSQFSFVNDSDLLSWSSYEWYLIAGFSNQLWNMPNTENIKIYTIYQFIFSDSKAKFTKYISSQILCIDSVIKHQLWDTFGWKGFLIALDLKSSILQRILLKDDYDIDLEGLVKYKEFMNTNDEDDVLSDDDNPNIQSEHALSINEVNEPLLPSFKRKSTNFVSAYYNSAQGMKKKWISKLYAVCNKLTLQNYTQPIHPYVAAKKSIIRIQQKMRTLNIPKLYQVENQYPFKYVCDYEHNVVDQNLNIVDFKMDITSTINTAFPIFENLVLVLGIILYAILITIFIVSFLAELVMACIVVRHHLGIGFENQCDGISYNVHSWMLVSCYIMFYGVCVPIGVLLELCFKASKPKIKISCGESTLFLLLFVVGSTACLIHIIETFTMTSCFLYNVDNISNHNILLLQLFCSLMSSAWSILFIFGVIISPFEMLIIIPFGISCLFILYSPILFIVECLGLANILSDSNIFLYFYISLVVIYEICVIAIGWVLKYDYLANFAVLIKYIISICNVVHIINLNIKYSVQMEDKWWPYRIVNIIAYGDVISTVICLVRFVYEGWCTCTCCCKSKPKTERKLSS
eukprot:531982_1